MKKCWKHLIFQRLLSSGYTGSYEISVGMSNAKLYLDEQIAYEYWKPDFIYDDIDEAMKEVRRILSKKYVQIEEYEIQIVYGNYMDQLRVAHKVKTFYREEKMAKKESSFHMGDEFNGNGKKTYLRATQHNTYAPLPQHNVRLTPDFSKFALAAIGAMPVGMEGAAAGTNAAIAMAVLGSVASVGQVKIEKKKETGKHKTSYFLRKIALTTGSYLHSIGGHNMILEEFLNKETVHYTKLGEWLYQIEMPYQNEDYILEDGNRIAVKPQNAQDGYVTIGAGHSIQDDDEANKYGFSTGENPAILTLDEARLLLEKDIEKKRKYAIRIIENTKKEIKEERNENNGEIEEMEIDIEHEFTENEIDAITSVLFNGNNYKSEKSFSYYLLRPCEDIRFRALNILHEAVENGYYNHEGTLRRRLMEYNIYFNNDYTFYDKDRLNELKEVVKWKEE